MNKSSERSCPVCCSIKYVEFAPERIELARITTFSYASRKCPEFMCLRMVRCLDCDAVYVLQPPRQSELAAAYTAAAYDSSEEADCASATYARILFPYVEKLAARNCAIDVGAGNGSFLPFLKKFGFINVIGVEPSSAAIDSAPSCVREKIRQGIFSPETLSDVQPDLICSFMTLEHLTNPCNFVISAYKMLRPGGAIALVVHNWQAWLNRILGLKSPIIDIEHMQLFCPKAANVLVKSAGFRDITIANFYNSYSLRYWLRLTPLPEGPKIFLEKTLRFFHVSSVVTPLPVGNMIVVAYK
ncbi:MAG: class I SAM-dependent methyltransferase [Parabacteroides sp.]|nr:class I SAM-dependent methyltransferase [Parabacteroides sp.]